MSEYDRVLDSIVTGLRWIEAQHADWKFLCTDLRARIDSIKADYPDIKERFSDGRFQNQAFSHREDRVRRVAEVIYTNSIRTDDRFIGEEATHYADQVARNSIEAAEIFEKEWDARQKKQAAPISAPAKSAGNPTRPNPDGGAQMDERGP
jgi:hypothetical protein